MHGRRRNTRLSMSSNACVAASKPCKLHVKCYRSSRYDPHEDVSSPHPCSPIAPPSAEYGDWVVVYIELIRFNFPYLRMRRLYNGYFRYNSSVAEQEAINVRTRLDALGRGRGLRHVIVSLELACITKRGDRRDLWNKVLSGMQRWLTRLSLTDLLT